MIEWYPDAVRVDAHPGRIGGPLLELRGAVVHTTDTLRGSAPAIVRSWSTTGGTAATSACAHGIIDVAGLFTQMVSFALNANHAGGQDHGLFGGMHPNLVTAGIELEAPGRLGTRHRGQWVHPDTGHIIPDDEAYVDDHGIGWGLVTDAQLATLGAILTWMSPALEAAKALGVVTHPGTYAENGVPWAAVPDGARVTGHATSNPIQKTDPGPQVMAWIAARGYR